MSSRHLLEPVCELRVRQWRCIERPLTSPSTLGRSPLAAYPSASPMSGVNDDLAFHLRFLRRQPWFEPHL